MDAASPAAASRYAPSHLGSSSSISLPAQQPSAQPADHVGMTLFWGVVIVAALATLLLYCWPAADRIARHEAALAEAEAALEQARAVHAGLEAELEALDDPFTIEWILRRDHNWQPTTER